MDVGRSDGGRGVGRVVMEGPDEEEGRKRTVRVRGVSPPGPLILYRPRSDSVRSQ